MIESDNEPGMLAKIADRLAAASVNIEYADLATSVRASKGLIILRPPTVEQALGALQGL